MHFPHAPHTQAFNVINGGSHAGNRLAMQEFMVLPVGAESFRDALRVGAELYQTLRGVIKEKYGQDATNVGDEGGFAPNIQENSEGKHNHCEDPHSVILPRHYQTSSSVSLSALELIKTAIEKAGFTDKVVIGMDVAASEFFIEGKYDLDFKSPPNAARNISAEELAGIYQGFINNYPGVYHDAGVIKVLKEQGWDLSFKFGFSQFVLLYTWTLLRFDFKLLFYSKILEYLSIKSIRSF